MCTQKYAERQPVCTVTLCKNQVAFAQEYATHLLRYRTEKKKNIAIDKECRSYNSPPTLIND